MHPLRRTTNITYTCVGVWHSLSIQLKVVSRAVNELVVCTLGATLTGV